MILVDSNVFFDLVDRDPVWEQWSAQQIRRNSSLHELITNPIVYAELSPRYASPDDVDAVLVNTGVRLMGLPKQAAFLAGKSFQQYRRQGGTRTSLLADFFIGAHAAVLGVAILTRDTRRYTNYFPMVRLIAP
jgi:predicted nucleic acid-binding protein